MGSKIRRRLGIRRGLRSLHGRSGLKSIELYLLRNITRMPQSTSFKLKIKRLLQTKCTDVVMRVRTDALRLGRNIEKKKEYKIRYNKFNYQ